MPTSTPLSAPDFLSKWTARFADNTIENITEATFREFAADIDVSFASAAAAPLQQNIGLVAAKALRATGTVQPLFYAIDFGADAASHPQTVYVRGLGPAAFDTRGVLAANGQVSQVSVNVAAGTFAGLADATGHPLNKLVLPMAVHGGQWYLTPVGIWEAKRDFAATVDPVAGADWLAVAGFTGQLPSAPTILAASIQDATAAGRAMLTAASAAAQLGLVDKLNIQAGKYGAHPGFTNAYKVDGLMEWVLKTLCSVLNVQVQKPADAPTNGVSDNVGYTFSFVANPLFPTAGQYKANGLPAIVGAAVLDGTNSYAQGGRIYIKIVGPVPLGSLSVYVAGTGNQPDGHPLVNEAAFTGAVPVVVSPATTPDAPTVAFDLASRILSASHPSYGTAELEYRRVSTGTVLAYAAIGVDGTAHAAAEWQYRVKAATGRNFSNWADSPAIAAVAVAATAPGAPTSTTATLTGPNISINGTAPASNGGAAITGYAVYRNGALLAPSVSLPYVDTTGSPGVAYAYTLAAINSVNQGPQSVASNQVTIPVPANAIPVANAGADLAITLPTSSVQLVGSGTDSDGTIAGYSWSQSAGPNTATFTSKLVASPVVSGLVAGQYTFHLITTDDKGAVALGDDVVVTVNAAVTTGRFRLRFIGDSISTPGGSPANPNSTQDVVTRLGTPSTVDVKYEGYPSRTAQWFIANQLARVKTEIQAEYNQYDKNVNVIFFGANDYTLQYPSEFNDPPRVAASIHNLAAELNALGGKVVTVFVPCMNRVDPAYAPADFDQKRAQGNGLCNGDSVFAAKVDVSTQPTMWGSSAPNSTTYFADKVHPSTSGATIVAEPIAYTVAPYLGLVLNPAYQPYMGVAADTGGTVNNSLAADPNLLNYDYNNVQNTIYTPANQTIGKNTTGTEHAWDGVAQYRVKSTGTGRFHLHLPSAGLSYNPSDPWQSIVVSVFSEPLDLTYSPVLPYRQQRFGMYYDAQKYGFMKRDNDAPVSTINWPANNFPNLDLVVGAANGAGVRAVTFYAGDRPISTDTTSFADFYVYAFFSSNGGSKIVNLTASGDNVGLVTYAPNPYVYPLFKATYAANVLAATATAATDFSAGGNFGLKVDTSLGYGECIVDNTGREGAAFIALFASLKTATQAFGAALASLYMNEDGSTVRSYQAGTAGTNFAAPNTTIRIRIDATGIKFYIAAATTPFASYGVLASVYFPAGLLNGPGSKLKNVTWSGPGVVAI